MKDPRGREPVVGQLPHSVPRHAMFLTAPPQRTQPDALDVVPECFQRLPVGRDGVIRASLERGPVKFHLLVQVAAADDSTTDATKVWPDSRPTVELGEIAVIKALDTKKVENELLFLPTNVTSGIDVSDDPIINTRTEAYAVSFGRRTK
jgi:catalase